jgi:hypothetical protein
LFINSTKISIFKKFAKFAANYDLSGPGTGYGTLEEWIWPQISQISQILLNVLIFVELMNETFCFERWGTEVKE